MFDPLKLKKDFPILSQKINGYPLTYLDNAATTQKPKCVIDKTIEYYENYNSNIGRSSDSLAIRALNAYEETRKTVQKFINAKHETEIIFTRNTTESINLAAHSWGEENILEGDEILVSIFEHHSNFVPWQNLAKKKNAKLLIAPLNNDLELDIEAFKKLLSEKTKIVCISACSNVLGLKEDLISLTEIIRANAKNAKILIDGAQSIAHQKTDVQKIDCDFFAFSGHKIFGPTGIGVLYGKKHLLETMPPFLIGGGNIIEVNNEFTDFADIPQKFEAGTQNIAGVIAFNEAINYFSSLDINEIMTHEKNLFDLAYSLFSKEKGVKIFAPKSTQKRSGILSFTLEKAHPHDIAQVFNEEGISTRAGLHCAHPLHLFLKIPATARLSFSIYNTEEDIEKAYKALQKTLKIFA
ncbi:MAG: SufS family cysteine desulfurase [Candidatus Gracilibacteria bacterium]|jgi:cysteine desulfurase/selenocysteine lyase|nr:SufS family cysteine desulfurase [Candidatus Gracilibacteria bacterium]